MKILKLWEFLQKHKLNVAQVYILKEIELSEEVTTKTLADALGLSQQTLRVYHLPKLEEQGYVGKKKPLAQQDQRYRPLILKVEGARLLRKFEEEVERVEGL